MGIKKCIHNISLKIILWKIKKTSTKYVWDTIDQEKYTKQ